MYFYTFGEPVRCVSGRLAKYVLPAPDIQSIPRKAIYAGVPGEAEAIRQDLLRQKGGRDADIPMRLIPDTVLAANAGFPFRLGRRSLAVDGIVGERFHEFEPEPLGAQLEELRIQNPYRQHYRIAIVNGFGTNLGDSLQGATALRVVAGYMRKRLPGVSFDLMLGPGTSAAAADFIRHVPGVERVRWSGIPLSDFELYDGYFDFSELLSLPRYHEMQPVDWYLWWMGLEPELIHPSEKRNRLVVRHDAFHAVKRALGSVGGKKIFFSRRASVPLRSFSEKEAGDFVRSLLELDESLVVVVEYALDVEHPRLLDFTGVIDTTEKLKAMMVLVDGAIVIDSLPLHLSDAAALSTVVISSSMPVDRLVRYYPHASGLLIPDAESLPGWGQPKITDPAAWDSMSEAYARAWGELQAEEVFSLLSEKMATADARRQASPPLYEFTVLPDRPVWVKTKTVDGHRFDITPSRMVLSPQSIAAAAAMSAIVPQIVFTGCTVVECGGGSGETTLELLRHAGSDGEVYVYEPRRLYFQLLCARAVLAGHDRLFAIQALPFLRSEDGISPSICDLDMLSPHDERMPGNSASMVSLSCEPLDELELPMCRLLVIHPPVSVVDTLNASRRMIDRCRPMILTAPRPPEDAGQFVASLAGMRYDSWEQPLAGLHGGTFSLFFAVPAEMAINIWGFRKLL